MINLKPQAISQSSRVLITGIAGFAGSHLSDYLLRERKCKIFGTVISTDNPNLEHIKNKIELTKCNLLDYSETEKAVRNSKPDFIFHLAALPSPAESFKNTSGTLTNNILAEASLLDSIKNLLTQGELNKSPRILIVASADEYGISHSTEPLDEETPMNPASPYAVSKIAQDYLGLEYFLAHKLDVIRVRPFNHIGPRQSPGFVISSFAKQIAQIEKSQKKHFLEVGNLKATRDFTDVRDMVIAYVLAIEEGKSGDVYNLGSGKGYKINNLLDMLKSLSTTKIEVRIDKSRFRPIDIPFLISNSSKFQKISGWKAQIPIEKTLEDVLNYWRERV